MPYIQELSYPTTLAPSIEPLRPGTGLGERADEALERLERFGFIAALHLTDRDVEMSTSDMAHEEDIAEWCPNDSISRFGDTGLAAQWQAKGRGVVGIYTATGCEGEQVPQVYFETGMQNMRRQVAWGWSGWEPNKAIPGADITTAYRVGSLGQDLVHEIRDMHPNKARRFSLGQPLGELVIATAVARFGARPQDISLEAWEMNERAIKLYERIGFVLGKVDEPEARPTLYDPGKTVEYIVDGERAAQVVQLRTVGKGDKARQLPTLMDRRKHYVLGDHPLLAAA